MDLEGLIWIAIAAIYFLMRGLGRKKRRPTATKPPTKTRRPEPERSEDLDEALRQIRQALGFPEQETPPAERRQESPAQTVERPPPPHEIESEKPRVERPLSEARAGETASRPRGDKQRVERPLAESGRVERPLSKARGAERPVEKPLSRPQLSPKPRADSSGKARPQRRARGADIPEHPLESSFVEEEAFSRAGRHAHPVREHSLRVVSPYEAARQRQLPGLMRRLTKKPALRETFLLKEVLDRPLAMRRRR